MKSIKYMCLALAAVLSAGFASCNDDDEYFDSKYQDEKMQITKVYLEDYESSVPDREVEYARLGQTLRLEGSGFMGIKKIYVNGYDTYFNRAYVTDNSMILSISSKTPVSDAEEAVRNTIRLVKDNLDYVYEFTIRAATPVIETVSCTLPVAGDKVTLTGSGLQEIAKVSLPGGVELTEGIESDEDGEWCTFVMPAGLSEGGSIVVEGANGIAKTPAYFNERRGMVMDFEDMSKRGSWGSASSMTLDDDLAADPLGKYGTVWQMVPDRLLADGIPAAKNRGTECWTVGDGDKAYEDWSRMADLIPADTNLKEVALQFDVYCPDVWTATGHIQIVLVNNFEFKGIGSDDDGTNSLTAFYCPWIVDGAEVPFSNTEWQTVTIPLADFGKYKAIYADKEATTTPTFQNVIDDRLAATYPNFGMGFVNTDFTLGDFKCESTPFMGPKVYIDNWRIVPCKEFSISDYPEDDEDEE